MIPIQASFDQQFKLPEQYTQANLQDFIDCRRRFLLKHIYKLPWPAIQSEPALESEHRARLGSQFHKLAFQFFIGVPKDKLEASIQDDELQMWWDQFVSLAQSPELTGERFAEVNLSAPLHDRRLVGKIDLLLKRPDGTFCIYDWKTTPQAPPPLLLAERLQTRIYPYLLACAGASYNRQQRIQAQQIEMIYWFTASGQASQSFQYSHKRFQEDQDYLEDLVKTIAHLPADQFVLTDQTRRCVYCQYRSYCERGLSAGMLDDLSDEAGPGDLSALTGFDLESIAEIEY